MSLMNRYLFPLGTVLALAANACSAAPARVASASEAPLACAGGSIQSEEDAARFRGCTAVSGDLRIVDSALSDLTALSSLHTVSGSLVVDNNSDLADFEGLERLNSVGRLEVSNNGQLVSMRGLEALQHARDVTIVNNAIYDTSGLSQLQEVGELVIADNAKLISLRGLNGLKRARSVQIRNNRVLCARLGFLPQLGQVSEALVVTANRTVFPRELDSLRERVKLQTTPRPASEMTREAALR